MRVEDEHKKPQETEEEDGLTLEEKAEKKELAQHNQFRQMADDTLNRWSESQPTEVRQSVIDSYIDTGEINHQVAGVDELEAQVVMAAFTQHVERSVLTPLGLTLSQWESYVEADDLPAFRRAAVKGDWGTFQRHAQTVASHIHHHGDVNADL
ncbi:hypothetical protein GOB12_02315 [Sinorhizobium meliloti]|nr:hypothetical protein [Sinorhizobium meliloti]MDX0392071.1 hypothetical protein [Sinorhizobium meliloti]